MCSVCSDSVSNYDIVLRFHYPNKDLEESVNKSTCMDTQLSLKFSIVI